MPAAIRNIFVNNKKAELIKTMMRDFHKKARRTCYDKFIIVNHQFFNYPKIFYHDSKQCHYH